jgi:hypothetical protein
MRAYNFITISIVVLLIALMPVRSEADDWPNWRGPQHNGISDETDWIGDWPAFEPVILWEQQVGTGFSSIAVADGRVYTMGNSTRMVALEWWKTRMPEADQAWVTNLQRWTRFSALIPTQEKSSGFMRMNPT